MKKLLGLDAGTRARAVISIITAVTDILAVFGVIKFNDEQLEAIKNLALVVVSALVWLIGFWYNENFTTEMCEATGEARMKKLVKKGKIADTEEIGGADDGVSDKVDEEL